ncbi:McrB family protein [Campylobacter sp. W0066.1]|uniref:McrB family protein n=1 Tax=Campylobacter sp. W0066.1 TaxID=2735751 RepID=UPI00301DD659|nr:AAA family ATPase [Campylobacter sp. W0066.1]
MNIWIYALKNDIEIKDIENYKNILVGDIIFGYIQIIENGGFFIVKKLVKKEDGQVEENDIESIKVDLPYSIMYCCKGGRFLYKLQKKEINFLLNEKILDDSKNKEEIDENIREKGGENIILYGVPGSGKSHTIKTKYPNNEYTFEKLVFHPDYSYSDFIGQIMPIVKDKIVSYDFIPGPFTNILKKAYNDPSGKYVLVIDEINRGNAPAIFGEVFQLLDRDKNGNSDYAINNENIAKIVYGKDDIEKPIKIPSNLWIIATMNTSDQNVFTLDTAFQRRFSMQLVKNSFDKKIQEFESEEKYNEYKNFIDKKILNTDVSWQIFCKTINSVISDNENDVSSMEDKRLGVFFVRNDDLENKEKFAHKVLKYLWDDVFKFDKDKLFNKNKYHTLEEVIERFVNEDEKSQFDIFIDDVKAMLYV